MRPHSRFFVLTILLLAPLLAPSTPSATADALPVPEPDPVADGFQPVQEPTPTDADVAARIPLSALPRNVQSAIEADNAADLARSSQLDTMSNYADALIERAALIEAQRLAGTEIVP